MGRAQGRGDAVSTNVDRFEVLLGVRRGGKPGEERPAPAEPSIPAVPLPSAAELLHEINMVRDPAVGTNSPAAAYNAFTAALRELTNVTDWKNRATDDQQRLAKAVAETAVELQVQELDVTRMLAQLGFDSPAWPDDIEATVRERVLGTARKNMHSWLLAQMGSGAYLNPDLLETRASRKMQAQTMRVLGDELQDGTDEQFKAVLGQDNWKQLSKKFSSPLRRRSPREFLSDSDLQDCLQHWLKAYTRRALFTETPDFGNMMKEQMLTVHANSARK